jgi:hypothetical protein
MTRSIAEGSNIRMGTSLRPSGYRFLDMHGSFTGVLMQRLRNN